MPREALPWRRDVAEIRTYLARWATEQFGPRATLGHCTMPDNGMANETILFEIGTDRLVARLAPHSEAPYPVFPVFDLALQRDCMELVRARTEVLVPEIVCYEEDPSWLGTPFLVMRHIDGEVPRDTPPYVLEGWMTALSAADLARLEENTIAVLAGIHSVQDQADLALFGDQGRSRSPLDRELSVQRDYYDWARDGREVPAIAEALTALEHALPDNDRSVLLWGDARIGNIIYRECRPVGVLDWEMATAGPPEVDVAWMVFLHRFMHEMITTFMPDAFSSVGLVGMTELFNRDRVVRAYERLSGEWLEDLGWYEAFAGLRFAIILMRMSLRAAAFGSMRPVEDADALIMFAPLLRQLITEIS
jgi:aminoglycoside phosphotransferase (APT) family kinase protein